jgi:RNA polymerase sigma-70 factor (ECF subfamily)
LVTALSEGDEKAFDAVFMDYFPKLKSYVYGFIGSEEEAENISQDVFMELWERHQTLAAVENLNAYLYKMAKNAVFHALQESLKKTLSPLQEGGDMADNSLTADDELALKELEELLMSEVEKMPEQRRRIFKMSRIDGLTNEEIATALHLSKRTVETHISAALSDLRKILIILYLIFINSM